ncbi:flavin reductase family protein [Radiobacillus sp. PE A8.2]|uniref:flavin reductase family protein n=1 Tax=Radiobacillus sp. PE A8.2 TaxID=3380349 RepID=UPI003890F018
MDNRLFRDAMGKFATGITVVTTKDEHGEVHGITVNAFMSVSLEPKLIAISIDNKASLYQTLQKTKQFGISVLTEKQKDYSMIFAKQMDKPEKINFTSLDGNPVLKDSLVTLSCFVKETATAGDHMIFIAEVTELNMDDAKPLLYFGGKYNQIRE